MVQRHGRPKQQAWLVGRRNYAASAQDTSAQVVFEIAEPSRRRATGGRLDNESIQRPRDAGLFRERESCGG